MYTIPQMEYVVLISFIYSWFILLIYDLFSNTLSGSDYIASDEGMIKELERIWKEASMAYFKVLSWYLPGVTEEKY
jgi:hypothetical protein